MDADARSTGSRPISRRIKAGLLATALAIILLLYPGRWELPFNALAVLIPRGCTNGFAALLLVPGLAINLVLMVVGVAAIVSAARRVQAGLILATLTDVTIATLFLIPSLTFPSTQDDMNSVSSVALTGIVAPIPLIGALLLLEPRAYSSRRVFLVTLVAGGLVFAPGVVGVIAFALELTGLIGLAAPVRGCA